MNRTLLKWGGIGLIAAVAGYGIHQQQLSAGRLKDELARLNRELAEAQNLRKANEDLAAKLGVFDLNGLRRERTEAAGLRAEIDRMRSEAEAKPARDQAQNSMLPASAWQFAGNKTPESAFQSVLWAATRGDLEHLAGLISFSAAGRAKADALLEGLPEAARTQYGTSESLVATMLADAMLVAMDQLSASEMGIHANLLMKLQKSDGSYKDTYFQLQNGPNGWQLIVPDSVVASYAQALTGPPAAGAQNP